MGTLRNGARTYLNILAKACKLSHLPGFRTGLEGILGDENATTLFNLWDPLCGFVESLIAADNFFNQIDTEPQGDGGEDIGLA